MGKTAYIFPGQGSQAVEMGKDLYEASPAARAVFQQADEILGYSISELCFEGPEEDLKATVNAQPALMVMSLACLEAVREKERETGKQLIPSADYMAGHSLGEYTALAASGALSYQDAITLAHERGRLMYEAGEKMPGAMAAIIGMAQEKVEKICEQAGVYIANFNCEGQIIISGEKAKILEARRQAKQEGAKMAIPLQVSGAFHSPLMKEAADGLKTAVEKTAMHAAQIPVIANTRVQELRDSVEDVRKELLDQLCHSVQWEKTVKRLHADGVDTFIEIGAGNVLTGLVKRICPQAEIINIGSMEDIRKLMDAV